jgi:hypothetical protein
VEIRSKETGERRYQNESNNERDTWKEVRRQKEKQTKDNICREENE